VLAACLVISSRARADDDPTTTAAARERFKEGVAYFDRKEYEKARAAFLQAYALKKHPDVLLNLAQSELRSGHEADAAKHFTQYLREATDASSTNRENAQAGLANARAAVIEVTVSVDEAGAEILVDGTSEGVAPLADPIFLAPGSHALEAKKGDKSVTQNISGKAGEKKEARLSFAAPPAAAAKPRDETQPKEPEAPSGSREPFFRWVTTRPAGFIPAGATVLLGLGAGGFAIGSSVRYNDADNTAAKINEAAQKDGVSTQGICVNPEAKIIGIEKYDGVNGDGTPNADEVALRQDRTGQYNTACANHQDFVDQGDTFKTTAIVLGVGAGVAAVATVVLYFTTAPKTGESAQNASGLSSVAVVPWATPNEGGIAVFGQF
jgi:tetratricopeptide (TPR) repeat protein